ncbi:MAG: hypothetical protein ACREV0_10825 [Burkholderiales bacterium]
MGKVAERVSRVKASFARQSAMLIARGEVIRAGRSLVVCRADVEVAKCGESRRCATLLLTLITMHGKG